MEEESIPRDDDLQLLLNNISSLKSGSDLRGSYADHEGGATTIANEIAALHHDGSAAAAAAMALFTPFAAYCIGAAFARWTRHLQQTELLSGKTSK
jgi:hypothetical protein